MRRVTATWALGLAALTGLAGCTALAPPAQPRTETEVRAPEAASPLTAQRGLTLRRQAVVTAHPLASAAGHRMLQAGGSAVDAAIAAQLVLGLVEPQSSGLGGGTFLLHWDGQRVQAYDGRETAPAAADARLLLDGSGEPLAFHAAAVGGRAVGVPGVMRMLEQVHRAHGRLPWATLFEPAIEVAEYGFDIGPRLHALLASETHLAQNPAAAALYFRRSASGALQPRAIGERLRNPAMAAMLRTLARDGADAFYRGPIARSITGAVQAHPTNPGRMQEADLATYQAIERPPLCADWRRWRLCGMGPPSSGPIAVIQILQMLDAAPSGGDVVNASLGVEFLHRYQEASRLAYVDRAQFIADPDFVSAPAGDWASLLDADYLSERATQIGPKAASEVRAGQPRRAATTSLWAPQADAIEHGTSHLSIVDADGQAVSMTTTIEDQFGARLLVDGGTGLPGGFLLNNELTDFAFAPADASGRPVANRVEPGKRPRSSMSPMFVFDRAQGTLQMVVGSPGGVMIPHFVAKALLATLAWGLTPQQAADLPNFGTPGAPLLLEAGRFPAATVDALRARGHRLIETELTSGIHLLQRVMTPDGLAWSGAADPRREGWVLGD